MTHIARDQSTQIKTTNNTEEPQQKYRLGTVSNRLLGGVGGGGLNMLTGPKPRPLFCSGYIN